MAPGLLSESTEESRATIGPGPKDGRRSNKTAGGGRGKQPRRPPGLTSSSNPDASADENGPVRSLRSSAAATSKPNVGPFWSKPLDELLAATVASAEGLPPEEAARRLARDGPNTIEAAHPHRGLRLLLAQFRSPIVLILVAATVLSMVIGDVADGSIILVIIAASGGLGVWQEHTLDELLAQVLIEAEVRRGGLELSVPVEEIVVGDVLVLTAGDVVPADCRVIESHGLLVMRRR